MDLTEERKLEKMGYRAVLGLDEAGRGPMAGPVVAAAVALKVSSDKLSEISLERLRDSKHLSPKQREEFYQVLTKHPGIRWSVARVSEKVIDRINILEATKLAMARAVKKLNPNVDFLILDGKMRLPLPFSQKSVIKADEKIFSCAAASIIAKVTRDGLMVRQHKKYPDYGFDLHKGYLTGHHLKMLKKFGPCAIHRNSFNYGSSKAKTYKIKKKQAKG